MSRRTVPRADELTIYELTVDYDKPLAEQIAAGRHDNVDREITTERFPAGRGGVERVEAVLVHLDREDPTATQARRRIRYLGLRPANLRELLAFGSAQPEMQGEFDIAALGSTCRLPDVGRVAPYLSANPSQRFLELYGVGPNHEWAETDRFLAIRG